MLDKSANYIKHTFEIKIHKEVTSDELAHALSNAEKEVCKFLEDELNIKLLEPPLEAEIIHRNNLIQINLTIKLVISPFSYYFSRKQDVIDAIIKKFHEIFISQIGLKGKDK